MTRRYVSASEFARLHGISRQRVCQKLRTGEIAGAKKNGKGTRWLLPIDAKVRVMKMVEVRYGK